MSGKRLLLVTGNELASRIIKLARSMSKKQVEVRQFLEFAEALDFEQKSSQPCCFVLEYSFLSDPANELEKLGQKNGLILVLKQFDELNLDLLQVISAGDVLLKNASDKELGFRLELCLQRLNREVEVQSKPWEGSGNFSLQLQNPGHVMSRLQDISGIAFWEYEVNSRQGYWSREHFRMLGYTAYEVQPNLDLFKRHLASEDLKSFETALDRAEKGEALDLSLRFMRRDKEVRYGHIQGEAYKDSRGLRYVFGTITDVTQFKKVENKLVELLESSQIRSKETNALLQAAKAVLGRENFKEVSESILEQHKGLTNFDFACLYMLDEQKGYKSFWPERVEKDSEYEQNVLKWLEDYMDKVVRTGNYLIENDLYQEEKKGNIERFLCVPIKITGKVHGGLCLFNKPGRFEENDIKMSNAFAELIAIAWSNYLNLTSLAKLAAAVEQAGEGISITDQQGRVEYANPAAANISGYKLYELKGREDPVFEKEQGQTENKDIFAQVSKGEVWQGQVESVKKDGRPVELDITVSPIFDAQGKITNYLTVKRDVTEKSKLEMQLRQSQKMEAIGTLAGGIAHDFNNMLMAIMGFIEMSMLHSNSQEKIYSYLNTAYGASLRARDLVQQILTFSRQKELKKQALQMELVVKESLKLLQATLPSNIEFKQSIGKDLGKVYADPSQVQQIVMNLCTNAGHAMLEKGGTLEVCLEQLELERRQIEEWPLVKKSKNQFLNGKYLLLKVKDTGHGISKENLERIFEPFFTTKEPNQGTGMGLSVVHGIVQDLRGEIAVNSEPGKGTCFRVLLPVVQEVQEAVKAAKKEDISSGKGRIIYVDDDPDLVYWAEQSLQKLGYQVFATKDPQEALKEYKKDPQAFDLLIADQTMPKISGLDLAKEMRKFNKDLPVIICSGYSYERENLRKEGVKFCQYLSKPFSMAELARALVDCLQD